MDGSGFDWTSISQDALNKLTSLCLNMLIDATSVDFAAEIAELSQRSGQKPGILKSLFRELLVLFQTAMKAGKSTTQLESLLISTLEMPQGIAANMCSVWQQNQGRISSSLLAKTLKANALVDLDWSFGVTASTSDMDQSGTAFLQLKMTVDKGEGCGGPKDVFLELSVDQFYSFLSSMEQCKNFLDLVANADN